MAEQRRFTKLQVSIKKFPILESLFLSEKLGEQRQKKNKNKNKHAKDE
jgi:hypothetical protein